MTTSVTPGVVISINDTEISLTPETFSDTGKSDIKFSLPHAVPLGTPANLATFLTENFGSGATLPNLDNLPAPLNTIAKRLANLEVSVESFDLLVPATKNADGSPVSPAKPNTYNIGLAGVWQDDPIALGPLKIKGVFLKVSEDGMPKSQPTS